MQKRWIKSTTNVESGKKSTSGTLASRESYVESSRPSITLKDNSGLTNHGLGFQIYHNGSAGAIPEHSHVASLMAGDLVLIQSFRAVELRRFFLFVSHL
ncbi:hypothetical protein Bca52824_007921 [Brassica carinata]|uniref:Uncharacterized protein n=1 Tax=Brassica carinata TaxID=52824 RepID=A0A8X8B8C5_BRACI|nr:hypothetical protein Bca52824_007921 [Brassica carinata]